MNPFKIIAFLFYKTWTYFQIRHAKARKKYDRKRCWVLRLSGRIYVFNKAEIQWYKKEGKFKEELNFIGLDKVAIYDTH